MVFVANKKVKYRKPVT